MRKLVIILGMHRSGTSLLTQYIYQMGAFIGKQSDIEGPNENNEDGYFENIIIREIHEKMLSELNLSWASMKAVDIHKLKNLEVYKQEISNELNKLFENNDLVAIKDPRIAYFLDLWDEVLRRENISATYLYVIRSADEVATSLNKRDGIPISYGIELWKTYNILFQQFLMNKTSLTLLFDELFSETISARIKDFIPELSIPDKVYLISKKQLRHNYSEILNIELDDICNKLYYSTLNKAAISALAGKLLYSKVDVSKRIVDFCFLDDCDKYLRGCIVIYGAGKYGRKAASMLKDLDAKKLLFCDKDKNKVGKKIDGIEVISVNELLLRSDEEICTIVSLYDYENVRRIERFFLSTSSMNLCSYFTLEKLWKMKCVDFRSLCGELSVKIHWYSELASRLRLIQEAVKTPIIVYQNGKVGSSTLVTTLNLLGIEAAHIHRNYFKTDCVREVMCGEEYEYFARRVSFGEDSSLLSNLSGIFKGKKIITLVRDPISVDLSTVFQWIGTDDTDLFYNNMAQNGFSFGEATSILMSKIQGRLFRWFKEELQEATGIDIFKYDFDRDRGFAVIKEKDTEILVIQTEKISKLKDIIGEFCGVKISKLQDANVADHKIYADLYCSAKTLLKLSPQYINSYYLENKDIKHFYSDTDINNFRERWMKLCIQK